MVTPWFAASAHPVVGLEHQSIMPQPFGGYLDTVGQGLYISGEDEYCGDVDEIETDDDYDDMEEIGANPWKLQRRGDRRARRLERLKDKYRRAKPGSRRQRRLANAIARLEGKQTRDAHKARAMGAALGLGPDALSRGDRVSPTVQAYETRAAQSEARSLEGFRRDIADVPAGGNQIRIPFLDGGNNRTVLTVLGGGGVQTFTLTLATPQITFAGFKVVGVDVSTALATGQNADGFPNSDILPSLEAQTLSVNGDINLFYATQQVEFAAQTDRLSKRTISGLRANPPLQPNNTANLILVYRQEINPTNNYNVRISAALVCERLYDPRAQTDV